MQPDDPSEAARQTLREQAGADELEDEQTYPADDIHGNTELQGTDQPGGVSEITGETDEVGGRPSEDGDADTDADEADAGHGRDIE